MYTRHFNSFLSRCRDLCTHRSFSRKSSAKTYYFKLDNLLRYVGNENVQKYFDKLQSDMSFLTQNIDMSCASTHIMKLIEERHHLKKNLISLNDWEVEKHEDKELSVMLDEEKISFESQLTLIECQLLDSFVPPLETGNEIILEITAGIGGKEAMLFAKEIYEMYCGYINYKSWNCTDTEIDLSPLGGVRHASMLLEGKDILLFMNQESGVHRIQRVPVTERSGRIHTSTATVVVLPQPQAIDIKLDEKDLVIETKRASGAGGQHVNKTESAVRITHLPTGLSVENQTDRSQIKNRRVAYQRLCLKIMTLQLQKQHSDADNSRKSQTGISARSDKIRTYNFLQDRITDHRLSKSFHNLSDFLKGGEELDSLIEELLLNSELERINSFINDLPKCIQ